MNVKTLALSIPLEYDKGLVVKMTRAFLDAQLGMGDKDPYFGPMWYAFQAAIKELEERGKS